MRIRDPGIEKFGSGIRDGKKSDPGSGIRTTALHRSIVLDDDLLLWYLYSSLFHGNSFWAASCPVGNHGDLAAGARGQRAQKGKKETL